MPDTTLRPTGPTADRPTRKLHRLVAVLLPGAPTSVVATPGTGTASVAFTAPAATGGGPVFGFRVTASTGQIATGTASPIACAATAGSVTFTVEAMSAAGYGPASAASAPVTVL